MLLCGRRSENITLKGATAEACGVSEERSLRQLGYCGRSTDGSNVATSQPLTKEVRIVVGGDSSTTDLAARRGVFSRRRYGSVEMLASCDGEGSESLVRRFRIENGEQVEKDEVYGSPSTPVLENPEYQTRWYFKFFLGKSCQSGYVIYTAYEEVMVTGVATKEASTCKA
ncbi:hypothetical protein AVEN_270717-1 [Araneus ventricosus]|uniref:Uncharacterized protein n=1 Tax=Araneus ventricosus TaxID=182803 RepID=A0A4Y2FGA6_ARAVE|nr:hypothetical protein AVEN_270717-1 [Araneus ventricosus]